MESEAWTLTWWLAVVHCLRFVGPGFVGPIGAITEAIHELRAEYASWLTAFAFELAWRGTLVRSIGAIPRAIAHIVAGHARTIGETLELVPCTLDN